MNAGVYRFATSLAMFSAAALLLAPMLRFDHSHSVLATLLGLLLCGIAVQSRARGILVTLAYLAFLGDYRRLVGYLAGYPASDPLLLVAPAAAFVMVLMSLIDNRRRAGSPLSLLIGAFTAIMVIEIFNPAQGGIAVGVAGALFYLVPILWFWIGRSYADAALVSTVLRRLLPAVAVLASVLGIYQSVVGLLPFEAAWTQAVGYTALFISKDVLRSIGFFTSSSEYTRFLLVSCVTLLALWLRDRSKLILWMPLLLVALFLASSRGPIVMLLGSAAVLWAVNVRRVSAWMPRLLIAAVAGAALLGAGLVGLRQANLGTRIDVLVAHQVEGLTHATDTEKSTAVGHVMLGLQGILEGITQPAGHGLGATTLSAAKYGEAAFSAEMDVANLFYSTGVLGGVLYLAIVAVVLAQAIRMWRRRRSAVDLAVLGMLVSTLMAWMLGGEYCIAALMWLMIGSVDRANVEFAAERRQWRRDAYRLG